MQPRQVPTKDVKPRVSAGEGKFDQAPATGLSSAAEQGKAAIEQQIKNVVPLQEGEHPKPQDVHKVCMEGHAPSQATHPVEARPQQSAEKATQAPKQAGVSTQAPKLAGASTQESAKKTCVLCTPGSKDPCLHGDLSDYQAQFNKNEFFGAELPSENCDFYYNYALKQLEVACGCHGVGPDCATYVGQAERAYTRVTLMERNVRTLSCHSLPSITLASFCVRCATSTHLMTALACSSCFPACFYVFIDLHLLFFFNSFVLDLAAFIPRFSTLRFPASARTRSWIRPFVLPGTPSYSTTTTSMPSSSSSANAFTTTKLPTRPSSTTSSSP